MAIRSTKRTNFCCGVHDLKEVNSLGGNGNTLTYCQWNLVLNCPRFVVGIEGSPGVSYLPETL